MKIMSIYIQNNQKMQTTQNKPDFGMQLADKNATLPKGTLTLTRKLLNNKLGNLFNKDKLRFLSTKILEKRISKGKVWHITPKEIDTIKTSKYPFTETQKAMDKAK